MNIDPRHLIQLATIVEAGSFQAAADLLGLTQPAISRNIKKLEERLGETLFDRSERSAKVNELGLKLARQGMIIKSAESTASSYADSIYKGETGTINIGTPPTIAHSLIAEILGRFLTAHPEVNAKIRIGMVHELRSLLIQGQVNIVIGPISLADQIDQLIATDLINDRVGILCSSNHPLTHYKNITPEILEAQRWALHSPGSLLRFQTEHALASFGLRELDIALETDSVDVAFQVARHSNIITTMPIFLSQTQLAIGGLAFLDIDNPLFTRPIGYIRRVSKTPTRVETKFIEFLKAQLDK
ncbi:LysR family transcriptional regulator [Marinomonas sp. 15G1-11]|uniref:LysR family transcriptional regulator n=1 Tax=Marinomonas phaeophyticola TaxID=3004091 RepID=A0ABT4JXN9_9GAMM|nr:LysR family transcriptional regulator [Marinomonas sp. 15G1-11]MCZ2723160.1 LysR family transcriptional regulator [Marinomonas sp. 15G1-11]